MITLESVTKYYSKKKVLDIKHLHIKEGQIYGVVGKNGAGKTTLFRLLSRLSYPTSGSINFNHTSDVLGLMIEQPFIDLTLTAYQNLKWISTLYNNKSNHSIDDIMELVKLSDHKNQRPCTYSLGMKQRLGIADRKSVV